ncbi:MAG: hypothetical protein HXX13_18200 [Bacteroidetes bacterium]|nr:hypothetical protein [Bacteroidota bacterium]
MKNLLISLIIVSALAFLTSCEKDSGKLPNISFKTGGTYVSKDTTLPAGTAITIGINASKAESKDVLKKFNISQSVNGSSATTVYDKGLSGSEGDSYAYDYATTVATTAGQTSKYTFTVTNRDGLTNQVFLTVTVQ